MVENSLKSTDIDTIVVDSQQIKDGNKKNKFKERQFGSLAERITRRRSLFAKIFQPLMMDSSKSSSDDSCKSTSEREFKIQDTKKTRNKLARARSFLSGVKSRSPRSDDQDSYEIDLSEQLAYERFRASATQKHGHDEAVIGFQDEEDEFGFEDLDSDINHSKSPISNASSPSPINWQASKLHRQEEISEDNIKSDKDDMKRDDSETKEISTCDKSTMTCGSMRALELKRAPEPKETQPKKQILAEEFTAMDRLANWRQLAARQRSPQTIDDSDLEDLFETDSLSEAVVISCSDDTSCSSVELIWSRRDENQCSPKLSGSKFSPISINNELSRSSQAEIHQYSGPLFRRFSVLDLARPFRARAESYQGVRHSVSATSTDWIANPLFNNDDNNNNNIGSRLHSKLGEVSKENLKSVCDKSEENDEGTKSKANSSNSDIDSLSPTMEGQASDQGRANSGDSEKKIKTKEMKNNKNKSRSDVYLSHIIYLDKKIKSNVSSIKNQLSEKISDTGKRASILADQLITTIKDTNIKEQLMFSGHSSNSEKRRQRRNRRRKKSSSDDKVSSNIVDEYNQQEAQISEKERLFSLIYKHQHNANGQQVITKQPTSVITLNGSQNLTPRANFISSPVIGSCQSLVLDNRQAQPNSGSIMIDNRSPNSLESSTNDDIAKDKVDVQDINKLKDENHKALDKKSFTSRESLFKKPLDSFSNGGSLEGARKVRKKRRKRRCRTQVNAALPSEDDSDS